MFKTPFLFHAFVVRRSINVLDPETQPGSGKIRSGSGALGLTAADLHQKYINKKKALKFI